MTDLAVPTPKRTEPAWVRPIGKTVRRRARRRVLLIVLGVLAAVVVASVLSVAFERLLPLR